MFDMTSCGLRKTITKRGPPGHKGPEIFAAGDAERTSVSHSLFKSITHLQQPHSNASIRIARGESCLESRGLLVHIILCLSNLLWRIVVCFHRGQGCSCEIIQVGKTAPLLCSYHMIKCIIIHRQQYLTSTHTHTHDTLSNEIWQRGSFWSPFFFICSHL